MTNTGTTTHPALALLAAELEQLTGRQSARLARLWGRYDAICGTRVDALSVVCPPQRSRRLNADALRPVLWFSQVVDDHRWWTDSIQLYTAAAFDPDATPVLPPTRGEDLDLAQWVDAKTFSFLVDIGVGPTLPATSDAVSTALGRVYATDPSPASFAARRHLDALHQAIISKPPNLDDLLAQQSRAAIGLSVRRLVPATSGRYGEDLIELEGNGLVVSVSARRFVRFDPALAWRGATMSAPIAGFRASSPCAVLATVRITPDDPDQWVLQAVSDVLAGFKSLPEREWGRFTNAGVVRECLKRLTTAADASSHQPKASR